MTGSTLCSWLARALPFHGFRCGTLPAGFSPEARRTPDRYTVQIGPVGLSFSWIRGRSNSIADGHESQRILGTPTDSSATTTKTTIEGAVLEGTTPRGQPNVPVVLRDDKGAAKESTKTDDKGKYAFKDIAAGNYRVLMNLADEMLTLAADRELPRLDDKLYLEAFAQPQRPARATAARKR